jgi:putative transposase
MGNTLLKAEEEPMSWKGVTVTEQRENFIRDYRTNYYGVGDLAERFSISRKTAYKWIRRWETGGLEALAEQSRRPRGCPWQTSESISQELVALRKAHPRWGPRKLLNLIERKHRGWQLPAISTAAKILKDAGLVQSKGRGRRAHPGCPKYQASEHWNPPKSVDT